MGAAFVWRDQYSLGQPDIDREHQALFRIARELHEAVERGDAQNKLAGIFARLVSYTKFHFSNEEELMRRANYPDAARHVAEHNRLTAKVAELECQFEAGDSMVTTDTMEFLRRWLDHHILGTDQKVAGHIRGSTGFSL